MIGIHSHHIPEMSSGIILRQCEGFTYVYVHLDGIIFNL